MLEVETEKKVWWTTLSFEYWKFVVAAVEEGLCYIDREEQPYDEWLAWAEKHCQGYTFVHDPERMRPYIEQIEAYLKGQLREFDMPLVYKGTAFQKAVWRSLCKIPYGETVTYAQIASEIGRPKAVRAVGAAVGANPLMIVIPCHRVIGKDRTLTGFGGGLDLKTRLLAIEGLTVRDGVVEG